MLVPAYSFGRREDTLKHELQQVRNRAETALKIVLAGSQNLLDIGLNDLTLGRTYLPEGRLSQETESRVKRRKKARLLTPPSIT